MYNTGNPIGSTAPKDFSDNSEITDRYVNDVVNETTQDRFGRSRLTIHGQQEKARRSFEQFESDAYNVIANLGFFPPIDYTTGLNVDSRNFTVTYNGVVYAAQPSAVPFTTGAWDAAQWYPIQNVMNQKNLLVFANYAEAQAAAATLPDGQIVDVADEKVRYVAQSGSLVFVENLNQFEIDLAKRNDPAKGAALVGYMGGTASSRFAQIVHAEDYGVTFDGVTDDTDAINAAISAVSAKGGGTVLFNTAGTCLLGKLTYFSGVDAGLTIYRNEWNLIVAKDNVRLHATAPVTLKAAGGLVASNKDEGGTKGYSIIGAGIRKVTNFAISGDFLFDGNGDNNLVFPLNWSGAQAHATAYSFYLGIDGFECVGARFENFPGANVGIIEWPSSGVLLRDLVAYRLSDTITGNVEVGDHSTFYTRATDYLIDNVKVEQPTESIVSTPFECHGSGTLRNCTAINTGTGHLSASFIAGHDGVINIENHTAIGVRSGFMADYQDGAKMKVFVNNARVVLRGTKRTTYGAIQKSAHAFSTNEPSTSYVQNCEVYFEVQGGSFTQATPIGWDASDNDLNSFARLVRIKGFKCRGANITGFKSDIGRIEAIVPGATVDIDGNIFTSCGTSAEPFVNYRAFSFLNSGLTDYAVNLDRLSFKGNKMYGCIYAVFVGTVVAPAGFLVAPNVLEIDGVITDTQIMPHEGGVPLVEWDWYVNYTIRNVTINTNNTPSLAAPLHGKIFFESTKVFGEDLQMRKTKNIARWVKTATMYSPAAPTIPLPFGDVIGDKYEVQYLAQGTPMFFVCKASGGNPSTLGTWVSVIPIP